ncbi:MAG: hypothetical protein ACOC2E_00120 [Bacteroidota bacterium]
MEEKIAGLKPKPIAVIINQMKAIAGFKFDKDLSDFFGITKASFSDYRKTGRIPLNRIFYFCEKYGVDYRRFFDNVEGETDNRAKDDLDILIDRLRNQPEKIERVIGYLQAVINN